MGAIEGGFRGLWFTVGPTVSAGWPGADIQLGSKRISAPQADCGSSPMHAWRHPSAGVRVQWVAHDATDLQYMCVRHGGYHIGVAQGI
jgi:hypothetical protein